MQTPYSGALKRTSGFYNLPSPLHVADPAHEQPGVFEGENAYTYTAPPSALPLEGNESWGSDYIVADMSAIFDQTPWDTSFGPTADVAITRVQDLDEPGGNDADFLRDSLPEHEQNLGATVAQNYAAPSLQFSDERYMGLDFESPGNSFAQGIPALAGGGQRGLNSLDENNPPLEMYGGQGYRRGHVNWWRVDRSFAARIIQRHDMKALFDNTAYGPTDQPGIGTPDSSGLPLFARAIKNINQTPQLRRTPEVPSSYVTDDGTGETYADIGAGFVAGGV